MPKKIAHARCPSLGFLVLSFSDWKPRGLGSEHARKNSREKQKKQLRGKKTKKNRIGHFGPRPKVSRTPRLHCALSRAAPVLGFSSQTARGTMGVLGSTGEA